MEFFILLVFVIFAFIFFFLYKVNFNSAELFKHEAEEKLEKDLSGLKYAIEEYQFYTVGHPYVWVNSNREQMLKAVKNSCYGFQGTAQPAQYKMKIDEEKKAIYYVASGTAKLEFGDLKHYQEWIDSKKAVSEAIKNYKNRAG